MFGIIYIIDLQKFWGKVLQHIRLSAPQKYARCITPLAPMEFDPFDPADPFWSRELPVMEYSWHMLT